MLWTNGFHYLLVIGLGLISAAAESMEQTDNTCSTMKYLKCDTDAICLEEDGEYVGCKCPEWLDGDGYKGLDKTGCGPKKCVFSTDCVPNAYCDDYFECKCAKGYHGNVGLECQDINECSDQPCPPTSDCENLPGGYQCICKSYLNYYGDGFNCNHTCGMDIECDKNETCNGGICICRDGYERQLYTCVDVNECEGETNPCDKNARCNNTVGGYTCTCNNGYSGNGEDCKVMPKNCHDIVLDNRKSRSGLYEVDPDGEGPLGPIEVECEMRPGLGITSIPLVDPKSKRFNKRINTRTYTYTHDLPIIRAIIESSGFCYQEQSLKAVKGAILMDGDDYWKNYFGTKEENWGGSDTPGTCACGSLGYCMNRTSSCNADGTNVTVYDSGKITRKDVLPVIEVTIVPGNGYADVQIGPVMCSPRPFDFPKHCDDAKFNRYYKIKQDGTQLIDVDGPEGPLNPVLVYCDMESNKHVGITVIPHGSTEFVTPTEPGNFSLHYRVDDDRMNKLIEISKFCSQYAEYECTNSRLMNKGDKKGFFSDIRGKEKNYWPGGLGEEYQCGCGITGTCTTDAFDCDCDIKDGKARSDFGEVIDKDDLPIGAITLLEIGGSASGRYRVGPLRCSQKQFGIPATCNDYVKEGFTANYTYLVDPDGPKISKTGKLPPFPVYCEIRGDPLYAVTILHHQWRDEVVFINKMFSFAYVRVIIEQIEALITRAVSCTQTISFSCEFAPLHAGGNARVQWFSKDGQMYSYYAGNGTNSASCTCGQTVPSSCVNGLECNCDVADHSLRTDFGLLTDKYQLPVMNITSFGYTSDASQMSLKVGPLECREIFPTCADIKAFDRYKFDSEYKMENGEHVIDPDGPGGVEPFTVSCRGPETKIPVDQGPDEPTESDPDNGVEKCYEVKYKSKLTGKPITPEQIQTLVKNSDYCSQMLKQECVNAPLTDHSTFITCDGVEQTGWAGSLGDDMCSCGVTGSCKGGLDGKCNCDVEDGKISEDSGNIVDKKRLAICKVCVSLNSTNSLPPNVEPKIRRVKPEVSELVCNSKPVGRGTSCQNWRDMGIVESESVIVDPTGDKPSPIECGISIDPPMGWTEIKPKVPEIIVPTNGTNVTFEYYVYNTQFILDLIEVSGYCTQEIWLECEESTFSLTGEQGFYSRDDERQSFWGGNEEGTTGCAGGECQCNLGGTRVDGGLVISSRLLPIKRVVLGPASGNRTIKLGPVKCFDLYKDCEDIRKNNAKTNPLRNNVYAIDPDGAGGVDPFSVVCDFKYAKNLGITLAKVELEENRAIRGFYPPLLYEVPIHYVSATPDQIHALANISGFCHQGMQYKCYKSPLTDKYSTNARYYHTYGGVPSSSFGVAGHSSVEGCACVVTDTCPEGHNCHCDNTGEPAVEYGNEIDRAVLPITKVAFGYQEGEDASASYDLSDISCAPEPVYLPKDCQEVFDRGLHSGEHLIMPSTDVEPFIAYCDMNILKNKGGVTIIGHKLGQRIPITYEETIELEYHDVDISGLKALTAISDYCFQGIKYECKNTKLLSEGGYFTWSDATGVHQRYVGSGHWYNQECTCGKVGFCGGSENRTTLPGLDRRCNCDANDGKERADAGFFNSTNHLPLVDALFAYTGNPESVGFLTVGPLYCSKHDFDLNECKLGFHDCDINAKCINTYGDFECQCKSGWRGRGRSDVWANGRDCYDDDECAMNMCPWSSNCLNLPGSYQCDCKAGFTQAGKRRCQDIDECQLGIHNCHENARCFNNPGGFDCRCNRNYKGDGISCTPLALCACFGDPHCMTPDGTLVDYQGQCQYIMSRDKCDNLDARPTFGVLTTFKPRIGVQTSANVTWVKEVTVTIYGYTIQLMQNNEVRLNGLTVIDFRSGELVIARTGNSVVIRTAIGIELSWSGDEVIELYIPGEFAGTTCGLCGNYNGDPSDDLMVGPMCDADAGEITNNFNIFGDSWAVESYVNQFPQCFANCSGPEEPVCNGTALALAKLHCNKVFSPTGIFKHCLEIMEPVVKAMLKDSCIYDACFAYGDVEKEVCESAAMVVNICKNQYRIEITKFRSEEFCNINCGENMEYQICGNATQRSCLDVVTDEYPDMPTYQCKEGCFCVDGFVLDGETCVLPEDCGCYFQGTYYKVGDEIFNGACNEKYICQQNGTMQWEEGIECHEFANCELRDGYHGCHCFEGYYGDGINSCNKDPCSENPCEWENTVCVRNETTGFECQCKMGFMGDCSDCTDIDECKTATYECPYHSECENTIGSYICKCDEGYDEYAGVCKDINECEMAALSHKQICGNNSRCTNHIGSYECTCCAGYEKNENEECVESESSSSQEGPKCCTCTTAICDRPGKVCGTDGNTYKNIREMMIHNCEHDLTNKKKVRVNYPGKCRDSCGNVNCPKYQNCTIQDGIPMCNCEDCTVEEQTSEPVCTSKLIVYPDYCIFKKIQCMFDAEVEPLDSMIPCEGKGHGKPVGPWSEWSECSVPCGKGVSTKTREAIIPLNPKQKEKFPLSLETDCYGPPCPDGPCDVESPCENNAAECFENVNGEAQCECPTCENQLDPVCGYMISTSEGFTEETYKSACHLQKLTCEEELQDFEVMHKGPCGVEPLNCTRVPYNDYVRDKENPSYVSDDKYPLFDCDGGCGRSKDKCCKPTITEELTVTLSNGEDTKQTTVHMIKECKCEDVAPPME